MNLWNYSVFLLFIFLICGVLFLDLTVLKISCNTFQHDRVSQDFNIWS